MNELFDGAPCCAEWWAVTPDRGITSVSSGRGPAADTLTRCAGGKPRCVLRDPALSWNICSAAACAVPCGCGQRGSARRRAGRGRRPECSGAALAWPGEGSVQSREAAAGYCWRWGSAQS